MCVCVCLCCNSKKKKRIQGPCIVYQLCMVQQNDFNIFLIVVTLHLNFAFVLLFIYFILKCKFISVADAKECSTQWRMCVALGFGLNDYNSWWRDRFFFLLFFFIVLVLLLWMNCNKDDRRYFIRNKTATKQNILRIRQRSTAWYSVYFVFFFYSLTKWESLL